MAEYSVLSHPDEHFVNKGLFHIVSLAKDKNKSITRARNRVLIEEYAALKTRLDDAGFPDGVTSMFVPLTDKGRKRLSRLYRKYSATDSELGRRIVLLHDLAEFMDDIVSRGLVRQKKSDVTGTQATSEVTVTESEQTEATSSQQQTPSEQTSQLKREDTELYTEQDDELPAGGAETKEEQRVTSAPMEVDTCSCKKHLQEFVQMLYTRYVVMEGEKAKLASERDAMYREMNTRMENLYTTQKREREKDSAELVNEARYKRAKTTDEFVNHFTGR
jgi:hypothetical protein